MNGRSDDMGGIGLVTWVVDRMEVVEEDDNKKLQRYLNSCC